LNQPVHNDDDRAAFVTEHAQRQWQIDQERTHEQDDDHRQRERDILPHHTPRFLAQADRKRDQFKPIADQDHVGGF